MGYDIDEDGLLGPPAKPVVSAPTPNSSVPPGPVAVSWNAAANATSYDVIAEDAGGATAYRASGLTGTGATIPAGALQGWQDHTIHVVSFNWRGYQRESVPIFVQGSCDSIDFNQDGVYPDTTDVTDFLFVFGGGSCPSPGCTSTDIDFNNDEVTPDTCDLFSFLHVFSGGACERCPL